jgi:hypothetical protein
MLAWFDCKAVDEFADGVVADLVKRVPPSAVGSPAKKAAERLRSTNDMIFARADARLSPQHDRGDQGSFPPQLQPAARR